MYTRTEVKNRYNNKAYRRYIFSPRHDKDEDMIEMIEAKREPGMSDNNLIKSIIREWMELSKK